MICGLQVRETIFISDTLCGAITLGGVVYEINLTFPVDDTTTVSLPSYLEVYHYITERSQALYGFKGRLSKQLFKDILTVQGVGCSVASKLLRKCSYKDIQKHIANKDAKALVATKAVGKKTAEKIVDKLCEQYKEYAETNLPKTTQKESRSTLLDEIIMDVTKGVSKLGFKGATVTATINNVLDTLKPDEALLHIELKREAFASQLFQEVFKQLRKG